MKGKYDFLVFDMDNTITESCTQITDDMANTLNNLKEELVFITGTHSTEIKRMISSKLNRSHHILANIGTHHLFINKTIEKEIYKETLKEDEKKEIITALKKLKNTYNLKPLTYEKDQIQDRGSQITLSILGRTAPKEKKTSYDANKEKRKKFVKFLKKTIKKKTYEFGIGGTTSIDITRKGNNKGVALEKFIKKFDISKKKLIFFGDQLSPGGNDYPVIKTGIKCIKVKNPNETLEILKKLL